MTSTQGQGQAPPAMGGSNQSSFQQQQAALLNFSSAQQLLAMQMAPQIAAGMVPPPVIAGAVIQDIFFGYSIEDMWAMLSNQLTTENYFIQIAGDVVSVWSKEEISYIIGAYRKRVGEPGMLVRDANVDRVLLGPAVYLTSQNLMTVAGQFPVLLAPEPGKESLSPSPDPAKAGLGKVPRPANAFIIYRQEHHADVLLKHPGIRNNDISVIIGKKWQNEPIEVRDAYKAKSEELKAKHLLTYPGYTYQPRKSSEKKRRKSKKSLDQSHSASIKMAKKYKHIAQESGVLAGDFDGVRTATFPATESAFYQIDRHNDQYRGEDRFEDANVVPNAEYVAAQQADELVVDLATNVAEVEMCINGESQYEGIYSSMIDEYGDIYTSMMDAYGDEHGNLGLDLDLDFSG